MIDLLSLTIPLKLREVSGEKPLPDWWGRAARKLLLDAVGTQNADLAQALHDHDDEKPEEARKPFTVSNLIGRYQQHKVIPGQTYLLRFTSLRSDVSQALLAARSDGILKPGNTVELTGFEFNVLEPLDSTSQPVDNTSLPAEKPAEAIQTTYQEMAASYMLATEPPPRWITFNLLSPTVFGAHRSSGKGIPPMTDKNRTVALPLPELVFLGLLEKWNAYAPITFPPEARRFAEECLALSRFDLSSRGVKVGGGMFIGAMGQVTYIILNQDRYWMSLMGMLSQFANFAGLGAKTTMGLGQCRLNEQRSSESET